MDFRASRVTDALAKDGIWEYKKTEVSTALEGGMTPPGLEQQTA